MTINGESSKLNTLNSELRHNLRYQGRDNGRRKPNARKGTYKFNAGSSTMMIDWCLCGKIGCSKGFRPHQTSSGFFCSSNTTRCVFPPYIVKRLGRAIFIDQPPQLWPENNHYISAQKRVSCLQEVNDVAERGVHCSQISSEIDQMPREARMSAPSSRVTESNARNVIHFILFYRFHEIRFLYSWNGLILRKVNTDRRKL